MKKNSFAARYLRSLLGDSRDQQVNATQPRSREGSLWKRYLRSLFQ
jgi:hypothetical protein